jgi:hypothetical protein
LIERNEKKRNSSHPFRWNHHEKKEREKERTNKRKLLASLFLLSSLHSGEREIENHRKRNKIKIPSMTISCLSFEYKKKRQ